MSADSDKAKGADLGRELSTAVVMFHEAVGAHLGVSAGDQRALALLSRHGPMSAGDLAEHTGLTPGAVTGIIDRLTRAGLARRDPDPTDRRRVLLTATGGQTTAFTNLAKAMQGLTNRYNQAELELIADYLTHTIDILREQTKRLTAHHQAR